MFQSPFGCSSFADLLSGAYTDTTDAGSLPEELDPFPELQLGNPQDVNNSEEPPSQNQHTVHSQPPPLPGDVQADSLRYIYFSTFSSYFLMNHLF